MEKTKIDAFFMYDTKIKKMDKSATDEQIQAEKIIYYYPNEVEEDVKVSHTSMMEGLSTFVNQFSKSNIDHIVTNENLLVMKKWYKSVFIALVVKNIYKNYKMELLMCNLLHSVLNNFISIFTFLHGHIRDFMKYKNGKKTESKNIQESLQALLDDYAFTYINTINNENLSIHNELQSFHFFPVEKPTYIAVQNLISSIILDHNQIKDGGLFFEGHLIYSSLEMADIKVIYNYLVSYNGVVNNLKLNHYPFKKIASSAAINTNGGLSSFARCNSIDDKDNFLLGIKKSSVFMPVVTLSDNEKYKLVVYIYKGILLMLLIKGKTIKDEDFDVLVDIQNKCTTENSISIYNLSKLNEDLSKQYKKHLSQEDTFRFFYYNSSNNSVKFSLNNKKITSKEFLVIADFHFLFANSLSTRNRYFGKNKNFRTKKKGSSSSELLNFDQNNLLTDAAQKEERLQLQTQEQNQSEREHKKEEPETKTETKTKTKNDKEKTPNEVTKENDQRENEQEQMKDDKERGKKTKGNVLEKDEEQEKKEKTQAKKTMEEKDEKQKKKIEEKDIEKKDKETDLKKKEETKQLQGVQPKKWKLVYNEKLQKKLFEDNSDEVHIEKFYYKEPNHPWVYGQKSLKRELFIFIDENKTSFSKMQQEVDALTNNNFANIYI